MPKFMLLFICSLSYSACFAQRINNKTPDSLVIKAIGNILDLNSSESNLLIKNSVPTLRKYLFCKYPEVNGFNNALVTLYLRKYAQTKPGIKIAESYIAKLNNQKGTFIKENPNFYCFYPPYQYKFNSANSVFSLLPKFRVPADWDDVAIINMAFPSTNINLNFVSNYCRQLNTPKNTRNLNIFFKQNIKNLQPFATWIGPGMPLEFDLVVLINIATSFLESNNQTAESDSLLHFINNTLRQNYWAKHPQRFSTQYQQNLIIAYHAARLHFWHPGSLTMATQLNLQSFLKAYKPKTSFENLLLANAVLMLGLEYPHHNWEICSVAHDYKYPFYVANYASVTPNPLNHLLGKLSLFKSNYYCPAFNLCVLLEWLYLSRQTKK